MISSMSMQTLIGPQAWSLAWGLGVLLLALSAGIVGRLVFGGRAAIARFAARLSLVGALLFGGLVGTAVLRGGEKIVGTNGTDQVSMPTNGTGQTSMPTNGICSLGAPAPLLLGDPEPPSPPELRFTSIEPGAAGVTLGLEWGTGMMFPFSQLAVYAKSYLTSPRWHHVGNHVIDATVNAGAIYISKSELSGVVESDSACFFRVATLDDADGDGLTDSYELLVLGTDPYLEDTDGDGISDYDEVTGTVNSNPLLADSDGDGLYDAEELEFGTNPLCRDSDGDGVDDREECGWVEFGVELPCFDVSNLDIVYDSANGDCDSDNFNIALPFAVKASGIFSTNVVACIDGLVGFVPVGGDWQLFYSDYLNEDIGESVYNDGSVTIAAYWDDLYSPQDSGAQIRAGSVVDGSVRWFVIEYLNIRLMECRNDVNSTASFQIAVSELDPYTVHVRYLSLNGYFDASSASVGAQGLGGNPNIPVAYNETGSVASGTVVSYHLGPGSDPMLDDTDGDGISDGDEIFVGTSAICADTDKDGMDDCWEINNLLDPLTDIENDGAWGDPDNDGLSNIREMELGSSPQDPDTDSDGLGDGKEAGGVALGSQFPWLSFNTSTMVDVTGILSVNGLASMSLPMAMTVRGVRFTHIKLDANGVVYINQTSDDGPMFQEWPRDMSSGCYYGGSIVLAPFWMDNLYFDTMAATPSHVWFGTASYDGETYMLAEYANLLYWRSGIGAQTVSFQIAIPMSNPDCAHVRFQDCVGIDMDGRCASIGLQSLGGRPRVSYCFHQNGRVASGLSLVFMFGLGTDPTRADSDDDGLIDPQELLLSTDPTQPDTDADGLDDGWEYQYMALGFNPILNNLVSGPETSNPFADPDGDGLTNRQECMWGTNPDGRDSDGDGIADGFDTDGDGVPDGMEVDQSSDPTDGTDCGMANSRVKVFLNFGDPSGSCSEKYTVDIQCSSGGVPHKVKRRNIEYGYCEVQPVLLKPGSSYEVKLFHSGTRPDYYADPCPDCDYTLEMNSPPVGVIVDDLQGLFGTYGTDSITFPAKGKTAQIRVVDIQVVVCNTRKNVWSELSDQSVILDDEDFKVKIVASPALLSYDEYRNEFGQVLDIVTSGSRTSGVSVPLSGRATYVRDFNTSELRITMSRSEMINIGLVPVAKDSVEEIAAFDMGVRDPSADSTLFDGLEFLKLTTSGYSFRGFAIGDDSRSFLDTPPTSIPSESFVKAAGAELVKVSFAGIESKWKQIMNQADYFYYSGHGHYDEGLLDDYSVEQIGDYWRRDLDCVIFAACSILDIGDYNAFFRSHRDYVPGEDLSLPGGFSPGKNGKLLALRNCWAIMLLLRSTRQANLKK